MDYTLIAKRVIKGIASPVLDACGIYDAALQRRVFGHPTWVILMYHRVVNDWQDDPFRLGMCIDEKVFAEQVEYHVREFSPIELGEAVHRASVGKPLPHNAISITFDDGYLDFRNVALPVLKRFDCPSTVFVTTGGLEDAAPFWWDRVTDAVHRTSCKDIDVAFLGDNGVRKLSLGVHHRRRSLQRLQNLLWEQPTDRLAHQIDRICEQLNVEGSGRLLAPRMNHADIAAIADEGVEIGAHCVEHVDLRQLSADACTHELVASRRLLQEVSGQSVDGFAFPGGRQNDQVRKLVTRAGFSYAASTLRGVNRQPYDRYSLRRVGAPDTGISDYKRCLATAAGPAPKAMKLQSVPWP